MEPFVQRMLERAKARREKLDTQLSNAGHDVKKRRSPLKDANTLLAQAAEKDCIAAADKSPVKSPIKVATESKVLAKSPRKSPISKTEKLFTSEDGEQADKENGEFRTCNVRSKLQRLGKLYSDDDSYQLSSPIHRTEEKFSAEEYTDHKPVKRGVRLDKLAALASTINNWEDDLSHPILTKPVKEDKAKKLQTKFNEQVKNESEPQPSTSGYRKFVNNNQKKIRDESPVKQLKLDKTVLQSLESNAVPKHVSSNKKDEKRTSLQKLDESPSNWKTENNTSVSESPADSSKSNVSKCSNTPEKLVKSANTTSSSRLLTRSGFNGSPKNLIQPSSGSVLSKASMFEAKNTDTKVKDPAQMTLAERMALFERNKGEAPLIPKAPLTMSIPPKKLQERGKSNIQSGSKTSDSSPTNNRNVDIPCKSVSAQRAIFEQGKSKIDEMENQILQATHTERQRELEMLCSRFNENKGIARAAVRSCVRTSESSEGGGGGKPSSPKNSPICPVKPTPAPDHVAAPPPPPPPLPQPQVVSYLSKPSPTKRQVIGNSPKVQHTNIVSDIKRIRVCPPKPGSLYPNLSEIEPSTESESNSEYTVDSSEAATATLDERSETGTSDYFQDDEDDFTESDQDSEQANTSFGRVILHELNERSLFNKKRSIEPDPDSTLSDISVLNEMDQYLDECLAGEESRVDIAREGPTPPKINKGGKSPSRHSNSFYYQSFRSPLKVISPSDSKNTYVDDGNSRVPLMRTVSAYRRQQLELARTPHRTVTRPAESDSVSGAEKSKCVEESILVENKVKQLLDDICTQQKKIEGASKALNLCQSTVEFNGSSENVGGEWALLVATHKRQAALGEVQRLKREGTLRPVKAGASEMQGSGSLIISGITLPLKQEFFRNMGANAHLHCVCLMRYLGEVVATQAATAEPGDSCLRFTSTLKFDNLYSDFVVNIEIYSLQTQPKYLPHEKKYHISHNGAKSVNKTPKKKSQFVMPNVHSPAGPVAIRSPAFQLSGTVTINLNHIHREQFTLLEVPSQSALQGNLRMHILRKLSVSVEHRGFLTVFEDISGLGAWDRRWCLLKDARLFYWVHPEDEHKKSPIGFLDLEDTCTKNVQFVNREKCARPFTFLLETVRPAQTGDSDSLVMKTNGIETTIEHFLLADTREEGLQWLSKLNKTLNLIRAWGPFRNPA